MEGWKKALLVAGAAGGEAFKGLYAPGAGCVLYYLLREEQETKQREGGEMEEKAR